MNSDSIEDEPVKIKKVPGDELSLIEKLIDSESAAMKFVKDNDFVSNLNAVVVLPNLIELLKDEVADEMIGNLCSLRRSSRGKSQVDPHVSPLSTPISSRNLNILSPEKEAESLIRKSKLRVCDSDKSDHGSPSKRVHFPDDNVIETMHFFKKAVRPKISLPGERSPGASILKNRQDDEGANNYQRRFRKKDNRRIRKKSLRTILMPSALSAVKCRLQKRLKKKTERQKLKLVVMHPRKKKSRKNYNLNCKILEYLCICENWFKVGPELQQHLSVCNRLQPRVLLSKLDS